MPRVVERKDADVAAAADLEPVYTAVRRDQPRGLLCGPVDRSHKVKRQKADRAGVGKDGDPLALMIAQVFPKARRSHGAGGAGNFRL